MEEATPAEAGRARLLAETSKDLKNAALLVLLPPFPDGAQRCTLWAEKNATQMTLSLEAEALPHARYAEAQPNTSRCTGEGLSIALTCLSE